MEPADRFWSVPVEQTARPEFYGLALGPVAVSQPLFQKSEDLLRGIGAVRFVLAVVKCCLSEWTVWLVVEGIFAVKNCGDDPTQSSVVEPHTY